MATTATIILNTGIGPRGAFMVNANCSRPIAFVLFGLMLIVATAVLLFALCAIRLSLKVSDFLSYFIINFIYVLSLIVCKNLSKISHDVSLFYCEFF